MCVDVVGVEGVAEVEGLDGVVADVPGLFAVEVGCFEAGELAWEAGQGW